MSEYWVSQPKHYCSACNCYIADNKPSRQHHESGLKHKNNVEAALKRKRNEKLHGARDERELQKQLAEINRAAREAVAFDKLHPNASSNFPTSGTTKKWEMPSVEEQRARHQSAGASFYDNNNSVDASNVADEPIEEENDGIYEIRGQIYLDGRIHEDKIVAGVKCEVYVQKEDDWLTGKILDRMEFPNPYGKSIKLFDVSYEVPPAPSEQQQTGAETKPLTINERRVKPDRIRLLANADGEAVLEDGSLVSTLLEQIARSSGSGGPSRNIYRAENPNINKDTGLGKWQTVAVRVVDEEQEQREHEEAREAMLEDQNTHSFAVASKSAAAVQLGTEETNHDSALAAYDPYQTNLYKGVKLQDDEDRKNDLESVAMGQSVAFKKRRVEVKFEEAVVAVKVESDIKVEPGVTVAADAVGDANGDGGSGSSSSSGAPVAIMKKSGGGSARNARRKPLD